MSSSTSAETGAVQRNTNVQYNGTIYDQPLCQQCLQLDFDAFSRDDGPSDQTHEFIGHFSHWSSGAGCPLCLLMRFTASRTDTPPSKLIPTVHYRDPWAQYREPDEPEGDVYLPFTLINTTEEHDKSFPIPGQPMPLPPFIVSSKAHGLDFVRRLQADSIDFGIISEWLTCCQKYHRCDQSQSPSSANIEHLRLIDCKTRSIIPGLGHQYVTLSYVWGPRAKDDTDDGFLETLPFKLPDTIEDSIQVTKKLGFQYIWIDRYCIDRRDGLKFKFQLHQMGDVYRNSSLTIVAAAGDRDSYGLPGVGNRPRVAQPYAKAGSHLLLSSLSHPQALVRESVWATRGWTFQEARLSSRRLYFTEEQVYYECKESWHSEVMKYDLDYLEEEGLFRLWIGGMGIANISYGQDDGTSLRNLYASQQDGLGRQKETRSGRNKHNWCWVSEYLWNQIALYTERSFTDPSDVLDGFAGLMAAFESAKPPYRFFWGIPIPPPIPAAVYYDRPWHEFQPSDQLEDFATTTEAGFLAGLCWIAREPLRRRIGFPSWSWTGWSGASCIGPYAYTEIEMHHFRDSVIDVELRGGNTIKWKDFLESRGRSELSSETPFYIHLSAWATPLKLVASNSDEDVGSMDLPLGRHMHWRFKRTGESALQLDKSYYAVWLTLGGESWRKREDTRGPGILVVMDTEDGKNTMERAGYGIIRHSNSTFYDEHGKKRPTVPSPALRVAPGWKKRANWFDGVWLEGPGMFLKTRQTFRIG